MLDSYLKNLSRVLGIGAGFASIPLFLSLASLQPPWPPAIGYVSASLVMVSALLAWEWTRAAKRSYRRSWIVAGVIILVVSLFLYLLLYSLFVESVPGSNYRVIRGFTCTEDAKMIYKSVCPDLPREALRDAEWESPILWTRVSITIVRLSITFTWLGFIAGLIVCTGSIIAGRKTKGRVEAVVLRRKQGRVSQRGSSKPID